MRAKQPAIDMHFVENHQFQGAEKPVPAIMSRQEGIMQEIGIGDEQIRSAPLQLFPLFCRGVSVQDGGPEFHSRQGTSFLQPCQLVPGQRLQRVEKQGAGLPVLLPQGPEGERIGQGLPAGGGSADDNRPSLCKRFQHLRLMPVKLLYTQLFQARFQGRSKFRRKKAGGLTGQCPVVDHAVFPGTAAQFPEPTGNGIRRKEPVVLSVAVIAHEAPSPFPVAGACGGTTIPEAARRPGTGPGRFCSPSAVRAAVPGRERGSPSPGE